MGARLLCGYCTRVYDAQYKREYKSDIKAFVDQLGRKRELFKNFREFRKHVLDTLMQDIFKFFRDPPTAWVTLGGTAFIGSGLPRHPLSRGCGPTRTVPGDRTRHPHTRCVAVHDPQAGTWKALCRRYPCTTSIAASDES